MVLNWIEIMNLLNSWLMLVIKAKQMNRLWMPCLKLLQEIFSKSKDKILTEVLDIIQHKKSK